jgi:magnesium-transporting ATPase (P-type)
VKKVIYFLLVCNLSEIIVMLFGQMSGWGLILSPVMLLLINILGDGIPGINLAKEESDLSLMNNKPINRNESFFSADMMRLILRQTVFCSVAVIAGYYVGAFLNLSETVLPSAQIGQTMAFLICGWTSIVHIFHVRSSKSVFKTSIRNNKSLVGSAAMMILVFWLMVLSPSVGKLFGLTPITGIHWWIVIGLTLLPTVAREIGMLIDNASFVKEHRKLAIDHHNLTKKHRKIMREEYYQMRKEYISNKHQIM